MNITDSCRWYVELNQWILWSSWAGHSTFINHGFVQCVTKSKVIPKEFLPCISYPEDISMHGSIADYETGCCRCLSIVQLNSYVVITLIRGIRRTWRLILLGWFFVFKCVCLGCVYYGDVHVGIKRTSELGQCRQGSCTGSQKIGYDHVPACL